MTKAVKHLLYRRLSDDMVGRIQGEKAAAWLGWGATDQARGWFEGFVGGVADWLEDGNCREAVVPLVSAPEGDPHDLHLRRRRLGARIGECHISQVTKVAEWTTPINEAPPEGETAYILLIRDEDDEFHARYVDSVDLLPPRVQALMPHPDKGGISFGHAGAMLEDDLARVAFEALIRHRNVLLYGPPGTGKTWLMQRVKAAFQEGTAGVRFDPTDLAAPLVEVGVRDPLLAQHAIPLGKPARHCEFVTFHQGTSYESFVAGLRPDVGAGGGIVYEVQSGPLILAAEHASELKRASLLLIDEVNRGNTAEIFGELITLLERDKRTAVDPKVDRLPDEAECEVALPYPPKDTQNQAVFKGRLRLPEHLYVLASMNSVDRSVAPLDSALRRRFQVIEVPPRPQKLKDRWSNIRDEVADDADREEWDNVAWIAYRMLIRINELIGCYRGPDFRLGHSYLWSVFKDEPITVAERKRRLFDAFADSILPQLREIFRDQPDVLAFALSGGQRSDWFVSRPDRGQVGLEGGGLEAEPLPWLDFGEPGPGRLGFPGSNDGRRSLKILGQVAGVTSEDPRWPDEIAFDDEEEEVVELAI